MSTPAKNSENSASLYGGVTHRRVTVRDLTRAKERGERWPMLTSYDATSARIFDEAGIPVLLVGDSAGNVVYGYDTTVPVTVDELLPLVAGVARSTERALVVADLPFGSYEGSPQQALETATRFLKEGRAQAVKLEGGEEVAPQVELLVEAGIPVMAHIGLTPQSVNTIGGFRVQGRGRAPNRSSRTPRKWSGRARSRSSWKWCRAILAPRSPSSWPFRPWVSAPVRVPTPRCWSGRTWPA